MNAFTKGISKHASLLVTCAVFVLMFGAGSVAYPGFFSAQVFLNLFVDNAFLGIVAVGMTLVILTGGIDLSVGSVIALSTMIAASLMEHAGWGPVETIMVVLAVGSTLGLIMGCMIAFFKIEPFIATLAGMFIARGLCYVISIDSISIGNEFFSTVSQTAIELPGENFITVNVIILAVVVIAGVILTTATRFGRVIYAIGGNEQSAILMGLPVRRTKVLVYVISGLCSAIAGLVFSFYMLSGYGLHAQGMELDAIAAVVIGGTLLTGGVGSVLGTLVGTLILGTIQTIITFQGTLSSWWTKIVIGLLIFVFFLIQTLLNRSIRKRGKAESENRPVRPEKKGEHLDKSA